MLITRNYPDWPDISDVPYQLMLRNIERLSWSSYAPALFVRPETGRRRSASAILEPDVANFAWGQDDRYLFYESMAPDGTYAWEIQTIGYQRMPAPGEGEFYRPEVTPAHQHEFEQFYRWMLRLKLAGAPIPSVHGLAAHGRDILKGWQIWRNPAHPRTQGVNLYRTRPVEAAEE